jgi:predicted 3-demethylubiquinone-9 3-methyltransferase (glyoxalase superfamily)
MTTMTKPSSIAPCLWFEHQAEEAALFYTSLFARSGVDRVARVDGRVLTVSFHLEGVAFTALNGARAPFTEAISMQVLCDGQAEVDRLWAALTEGGSESRCGWLKDRYGLSWQIVPDALPALMSDPDPARVARVVQAFMPMAKLELEPLLRAHRGE